MLGLDNDDNINSSQHLLVMARGNGPFDVTGCLPRAWAGGLVVAGLTGRLFCAFAHLILTRACGYQCFQRGELGFGGLRCFSCSPIAASPPVSTRAQSQERPRPPSPDREAVSLSCAGEATHKRSREKTHLLPSVGPSTQLGCSWTLPSLVSLSVPFHLTSFELNSCHLRSPHR